MCPSKIEAAYSKSLLFSLYACEQLPGSIAAITFLGSKVRLTPAGLQLALREDWPDISQLQPSWSSPSCHDPSVTESNLPSTANVLQKTFLLLLTSPTHLNSSSVLAFPVWSLHAQVRLLYPSQTACLFLFSPSLLFACIPYSLAAAWLPALRVEETEKQSWGHCPWRAANSLGALSFRAASYWIPPTGFLKKLMSAFLKSKGVPLLLAFPDNFKCHHLTIAAAKAVTSYRIPNPFFLIPAEPLCLSVCPAPVSKDWEATLRGCGLQLPGSAQCHHRGYMQIYDCICKDGVSWQSKSTTKNKCSGVVLLTQGKNNQLFRAQRIKPTEFPGHSFQRDFQRGPRYLQQPSEFLGSWRA